MTVNAKRVRTRLIGEHRRSPRGQNFLEKLAGMTDREVLLTYEQDEDENGPLSPPSKDPGPSPLTAPNAPQGPSSGVLGDSGGKPARRRSRRKAPTE